MQNVSSMKAKWFAIGLFINFLVNSCHIMCGCSPEVPDTMIDVVVKNNAGQDMLNPTTQRYFTANDIELYYFDGRNKTNESAYHVSIKQGVEYDQNTFDGFTYRLSIDSNYPSSNSTAVTLLEFENLRTDTITCAYSGLNMTEIKVNGKIFWSADSQKFKTIEIIAAR